MILFDIENLDDFRAKLNAEVDRLKIALVSHNPERLPALFPQFVESKPSTVEELDRGLEAGAPLTVDTVMTPEEALKFLSSSSLSSSDLDAGQDF